jgi:hypothetical protein
MKSHYRYYRFKEERTVMKTLRPSVILAALLVLTLPPVATADHVSAEWEDGTTGGWLPATGAATLAVHASGGYDGGFLESYEDPMVYGIVGALNQGAAYTGDFAAHGYVRFQVAIQFISGDFDVVYFHVRYQDGSHNGWYLPLPADTGSDQWQWFDVHFDPGWSDPQAAAEGWLQESNTPDFTTTMSDVYHTAVKATGTGPLHLGIDAFRLWDATTPTRSASWGAVKALYR